MAAPRDQESSLLRPLKTPGTPFSSSMDMIGRAETLRFVRTDLLVRPPSVEAVATSAVDSRPVAASVDVAVALVGVAAASVEDSEVAARTEVVEVGLLVEPRAELQATMRTLNPIRRTHSQTSRALAASLAT
jgi:hypothetical protein